MKRNLIILATLSALIFTGCKNKDTNQEQTPEPQGEIVEDLTPDFQVDAEICETLGTIEDKSAYKIKLNYTDKYFKYSASTFRKDLMLLSFGATNSMVQKESGQKFFSGIGFTSLYASPEYDSLGTEDSAQYIIAKKKIDDFTVFAVSFKGNKYGLEWANNFTLGESGDHAGFMQTATNVYNNLLTYISNEHNYKLWFSGYSRGGALSNILSHLVLSNENLGINEDNLYTYTFAGTRGLTQENAKPYKNVFNLFNSADLLSNFAPKEYGLYRCGTDIDIFDEHLDDYLSSFSEGLKLDKFTESKGMYKNDKEFTQYFLKQLLKEDTSTFDPEKYPYDLTNREHYFEIQDDVSYLLSHILGMPDSLTILQENFANIEKSEILSYLSDNGEKIYEKLKGIFDENNVDYDDQTLMNSCEVLITLLKRYSGMLLKMSSNSNAIRMISMHYPEIVYILIQRIE